MIGIIANPASGKDIRRLVAQGTVFDNMEKVNIIQRILVVLHNAGIKDIYMMPDSFRILESAVFALARNLRIDAEVSEIDMICENNQNDSAKAAELLLELGANCIITLGGDGTNRAVAKGCGDVPLIPLSTGTNNVFPKVIEGTVAGMAAVVAELDTERAFFRTRRCKRLCVYKNYELVDMALVDAAVTKDRFIGARALWDLDAITEIFVTMARADSIGMSAIAGYFHPVPENGPTGLYIEIGKRCGFSVRVPIAPGMVEEISVGEVRELLPGERIKIATPEGIIALDGEREVPFRKGDVMEIGLGHDGPFVVEVEQTLTSAARGGFFVKRF
ncbi:MAG: NAD(+)/NADH kinase [Synergistaceae bacterium]|jgi:predicted polyphosphate/ATP-dependent NAD kinase|nr:NAD(+)/NADH kinase [Synergistaceae bacterium]